MVLLCIIRWDGELLTVFYQLYREYCKIVQYHGEEMSLIMMVMIMSRR